MNSQYKIDISKYIKLRQELHKIPEFAYKEFKTKNKLFEIFNELSGFKENAKISEIGETGFYIDIFGKNEESSIPEDKIIKIALRADMDALQLQDESDNHYKSIIPNMCHACGHDGHMAILAGVLDVYLKNIQLIPHNFAVRFLFQPAEEGQGGARAMIAGGCLDSVDEIYGLHNIPIIKLGYIGILPGPIMGGMGTFKINIKGKGGHTAFPHECKNPISVGAKLIESFNQIPSQEIDSADACVIAVGYFNCGHTYNVINGDGKIMGTIRTLKDEVMDFVIERMKQICLSIAEQEKVEIDLLIDGLGPCTVNHKIPAELVENIAKQHFKATRENLPVMASEDFCFFMHIVPGCFFMLGGGDENHIDYVHTPKFDFNDKSLVIGIEMFLKIIELKAGNISLN